MACELLSLGSEATASETVRNSPEFVVPARTTFAPAGGLVREAAQATSSNETQVKRATKKRSIWI